ncbi:hypothetical protein FT643_04695 [Ketobacter sp. MCCC 1A13808]|uniref:TA system antitoxin ParD family protein n=1 Tax=Ketobacter sp. MCCC 1A13808 TaxID=2602738 RepID=UPI000F0E939E|nr:hypothetical protein [Ketobacter sp. MCCC 1A13808]MVF11437.1 hypothetical protein [Ketobacter sp. MCCC 1A13808]RLP54624.1 MAG: hypothetical protein D6160_09445 [Ketobacter sp.]
MSRFVNMSDEIVGIAENEMLISGRSLAGQIEFWAKIGRAIERSPQFSYERIKAALSAQIAYDDLTFQEQEVFHEELTEALWAEPGTATKTLYAQLTGPGLDENGKTIFPGDQS